MKSNALMNHVDILLLQWIQLFVLIWIPPMENKMSFFSFLNEWRQGYFTIPK